MTAREQGGSPTREPRPLDGESIGSADRRKGKKGRLYRAIEHVLASVWGGVSPCQTGGARQTTITGASEREPALVPREQLRVPGHQEAKILVTIADVATFLA